MSHHLQRRHVLAALLALPAWSWLRAQPAPTAAPRGRVVIGVSTGSTLDTLTRRIANTWSEQHALNFEVENLPGAGGMLSLNRVLAAPADGRTLLVANSGLICVTPHMLKGAARMDIEQRLAPLAMLVKTPFVLYTAPQSDIRSIADIRTRLARAGHPLHYAVGLLYGGHHIAGQLLFNHLGIESKAVSYTQTGQMLLDVATQRVPFGIASWSSLAPMLAQQRLRPLAVLCADRLPNAPDIPALREQGLAECAHEGWVGIFHRRETAPADVHPTARALRHMFGARPAPLDLTDQGMLNFYHDAAASAEFVHKEIARHRVLLDSMNLV